MALLIGVLLSFVTLGHMRGFSRTTVLRFRNECLAPTATITILVGAGGGFGRILQDSGVSQAIILVALHTHISLLLLAWLLAASMRLATGSATVAMTTAASIVAPIALHAPGVHPELLVIATGAGSLIFSNVNDGGFWLVKESFDMTVAQTLKTWSVCETIISVTSLGLNRCFVAGSQISEVHAHCLGDRERVRQWLEACTSCSTPGTIALRSTASGAFSF